MADLLLTTRQVAERWQLCPETVLRMKRAGRLPFVTLPSGAIRFRLADVEQVGSAAMLRKSNGRATRKRPRPGNRRMSPDAL